MSNASTLTILLGVCLFIGIVSISRSVNEVKYPSLSDSGMVATSMPKEIRRANNETLLKAASQPPVQAGQHVSTSKSTHSIISTDLLKQKNFEMTVRKDDKGNELICSPWENNVDDWWIHHPEYDIVLETDNEFCFSRIEDSKRVEALTELYQIQWHGNCSEMLQTPTHSSGFGAAFGGHVRNLYGTYHDKVPYQWTKRHNASKWLYAATNRSSWGWCESMNVDCYFLPISKCRSTIGVSDNIRRRPGFVNGKGLPLWVRWWAGRLQQHVRYRIHRMLRDQFPPLHLPCTAMHVRRGDAGLTRPPFRRYAALSEYVEAANISAGDRVVLLTDDVTTIEEAHQFHPHIIWLYVNRTRHRGTSGGFDGHTPSNDPALDMAFLLAEIRYASRCTSFVHGKSGFVDEISQEMFRLGTNVRQYHVRTDVSPSEARKHNRNQRADIMLRSILQNNTDKQSLPQEK